ncbi:hypothetical protein [Estrella lausannensis]|uniref:Uncharacterized protein n=1 Tax=Estrella lausannensis TaxID=483423 RepID=A0A0H5DRK4_9BACT|nr:hypothetical protein [Estrella lausannensis]CRX38329.1 hypothetical protein ELAC_0983 [Estrella lausannensis]
MQSAEELRKWLGNSSRFIEENATNLKAEQLPDLFLELLLLPPQEQKEKLTALLSGIKSNSALTLIGKLLTPSQFLTLLEEPSTCTPSILNPLLAGFPEPLFLDCISLASKETLTALGRQTFGEPIEHHLAAAVQTVDNSLQQLYDSLKISEHDIQLLETGTLTGADLKRIKESFDSLGMKAHLILHLLGNLLLLAWNSGRAEMIDSLSTAKESSSKLIVQVIGKEGNGETPASGMYYLLKLKLDSVYETKDPQKGKVHLSNDHPALEALSCLSLWYVQDYLEKGLLDHEDIQSLDIEKDSTELHLLAKAKLERVGIKTVGDLKREKIYSIPLLNEFLHRVKE